VQSDSTGWPANGASQRDWFYFVNGSSLVARATYRLSPGQRWLQWDYRDGRCHRPRAGDRRRLSGPFVHGRAVRGAHRAPSARPVERPHASRAAAADTAQGVIVSRARSGRAPATHDPCGRGSWGAVKQIRAAAALEHGTRAQRVRARGAGGACGSSIRTARRAGGAAQGPPAGGDQPEASGRCGS